MKIKSALIATATALTSIGIAFTAKADTVAAHCDIYAPGDSYPSLSHNCTFSQRQGFVDIRLDSGREYDFRPVGDQPGNFVDENGNAVYRQAGLGTDGQIFQLPDGSKLYVYWDTSSSYGRQPAQVVNARVATLMARETGAQINLRTSPTIYSRANGYGLAGDQVNILECVQDSDTVGSDLNWCRVQFLQSGAIGWIRSDFIIFPSDGF
ncbi:MAG: SH3 domain-containing protein [Leptolyngbyaceae bacterium]|nr:SH3 domain-containing protein [Leptolyngbyaceae bacterium]